MTRTRRSGFTLIELMIAAAIIAVLAMIAIPKFAGLIYRAKEASLLGKLGAVRSALTIYISDNEGTPPVISGLRELTLSKVALVPKYMDAFPKILLLHPSHRADSSWGINERYKGLLTDRAADASSEDAAGAAVIVHLRALPGYRFNPSPEYIESLALMCTHQDSKGVVWSTY